MTCSALSLMEFERAVASAASAAASGPRLTVPAMGWVIMRERLGGGEVDAGDVGAVEECIEGSMGGGMEGSSLTRSSGEAPTMEKSEQER